MAGAPRTQPATTYLTRMVLNLKHCQPLVFDLCRLARLFCARDRRCQCSVVLAKLVAHVFQGRLPDDRAHAVSVFPDDAEVSQFSPLLLVGRPTEVDDHRVQVGILVVEYPV